MKTHFLVHHQDDDVGVVVVEEVSAGQELSGWVMDTDETIHITAKEPIPLGHKVALRDLEVGAAVIKYGHDIGQTISAIPRGAHLHVHNTKTRRW